MNKFVFGLVVLGCIAANQAFRFREYNHLLVLDVVVHRPAKFSKVAIFPLRPKSNNHFDVAFPTGFKHKSKNV